MEKFGGGIEIPVSDEGTVNEQVMIEIARENVRKSET